MDEIKPFSVNARLLKMGTYEHYSGKRYKILSIARHTESLEELVVYQGLYGSYDIWVRPLTMFMEEVEIDNCTVPRFKYIEESSQ